MLYSKIFGNDAKLIKYRFYSTFFPYLNMFSFSLILKTLKIVCKV